jgi:carboxyl-terminal processing protease
MHSALDYAHKDKMAAIRTDENYNSFKTRKGRSVYDGGGVLPDIQLEETKTSTIANALLKMTGFSIMLLSIIIKP